LTSLIKKFVSLSFPLKFLIGSIFGIIAGPGLIAFLSEYATYTYAIRINIRPPLEGIPYLSASVALASLFLSIIAVSIFLISRWILTKMVSFPINNIRDIFDILNSIKESKFNSGKVVDDSIKSLRDLKTKKAIIIILVVATAISLLLFGFVKLGALVSGTKEPEISGLIALFIYLVIVLLSLWKPIFNWIIAISSAILFYIFSFNFLFDLNHYSNYLRVIKYGGGINIELEYKDTKQKEQVVLLLRTLDYVFIKTKSETNPIELPLENVRSIKYD